MKNIFPHFSILQSINSAFWTADCTFFRSFRDHPPFHKVTIRFAGSCYPHSTYRFLRCTANGLDLSGNRAIRFTVSSHLSPFQQLSPAHCTVLRQRLDRNMEQIHFISVGIRHNSAFKTLRAPRNRSYQVGYSTTGKQLSAVEREKFFAFSSSPTFSSVFIPLLYICNIFSL